MNDDGVMAMAFKILVRLLTASPLSALAFGLLVLISGSAVCEYYMITLGRGTDAYYPWMFGTFILGLLIWCAFLWRCLDFRWWSYSGWRFKLMTIRPAWLMGFLFSTFICIYVLTSVLEIECAYVKEDPTEFVMNMEVFGKIMRICGRIFREVLFNAAIVAVVSLFALFDDERRDKLADHIDQPRRCP
jgi:cytochrome b561